MPKPTIEFTHTSAFELVKPDAASVGVQASYRVLAEDVATGDKTIILVHPPAQEWGGEAGKESQASHAYWEVGGDSMMLHHADGYGEWAGSADTARKDLRQDVAAVVLWSVHSPFSAVCLVIRVNCV
ncbi:hypothetical protein HWV62_10967 [Athelia sp. TMB]|nr:hypothetical protein HWV62_10967 [Athelia sp. TMB]